MKEYITIKNKVEITDRFLEFYKNRYLAIYVDEKYKFVLLSDNTENIVLLTSDFIKENYVIISELLNNISILIFYDAKTELKVLDKVNIKIYTNIFDIMLATKIIGISNNSKSEIKSTIGDAINDAIDNISMYYEQRNLLVNRIKELKLEKIAEIEFSCVKGIAEMENTGFRIDEKGWEGLIKKYQEKMQEKLLEISGFFKNSNVQVSLFGENEELIKKIHSNKLVLEKLKEYGIETQTTSKKVLLQYKENDFVKNLLDYRELDKIYTSSLLNITSKISEGKVFPEYSQIGAGSGRMSCFNPNIQQIPREKEIRECFLPSNEQNVFVIADYSQIELRVVAEISKDIRMIEAYKNKKDLHSTTASLLLNKEIESLTKEERQSAKAINFGLVYAMGAEALKRYCDNVFGIKISIEDAQKLREKFLEVYIGVRNWQNMISKNNPKEARSLAGRLFRYGSNDGLASKCNIPVQGSAADIIKEAIGKTYINLKGKNARLVAVIHDEIIIETSMEEKDVVKSILKKSMENVAKDYMKNVPLLAEVTVSKNWTK